MNRKEKTKAGNFLKQGLGHVLYDIRAMQFGKPSQKADPLVRFIYWKHVSNIFSGSAELLFHKTVGIFYIEIGKAHCSFSLSLAKGTGIDTQTCFLCSRVFAIGSSFQGSLSNRSGRLKALARPTGTVLWGWAAYKGQMSIILRTCYP